MVKKNSTFRPRVRNILMIKAQTLFARAKERVAKVNKGKFGKISATKKNFFFFTLPRKTNGKGATKSFTGKSGEYKQCSFPKLITRAYGPFFFGLLNNDV